MGFVAIVGPESVDRALAELAAQGLTAWVLGDVSDEGTYRIDDAHELTRGTKGVDGGAVQVVGAHPVAW